MSRRTSLLTLCAVIAGSILGLVLAQSIPSAGFPQIQFQRAIILADSGDLPSAQMLVGVTRRLEEAAYGKTGRVAEALRFIGVALAAANDIGQHSTEPELHRIKR